MANLLEIKDRVQRYMTASAGQVALTDTGQLTFRQGSTRFFIDVYEHQNADNVMVRVFCPMVFGIPPTEELFKHIALHANDYIFGHMSAAEADDGIRIDFTHTLLGDYLDEEELRWAVGAMALTADEVDDKLVEQFGGRVFHDD